MHYSDVCTACGRDLMGLIFRCNRCMVRATDGRSARVGPVGPSACSIIVSRTEPKKLRDDDGVVCITIKLHVIVVAGTRFLGGVIEDKGKQLASLMCVEG